MLRILWDYLIFRLNSKPRKGYGIHSPFLFELYTKVIDAEIQSEFFDVIENTRKELKNSTDYINSFQFGAGSNYKNNTHRVKDIAKAAPVSPSLGKLLFRLVNYFKPENIIELGTSLGLSSLYLAAANPDSNVFTIEGNKELSAIAQTNVKKVGLENISFICGDFSDKFPELLNGINRVDFAFIDGDHSEESTIKNFHLLKSKSWENTVIVIDDIRWSRGMFKAWKLIVSDNDVGISLDLFRCGVVFFRKGIVKQHFNLRFGPY